MIIYYISYTQESANFKKMKEDEKFKKDKIDPEIFESFCAFFTLQKKNDALFSSFDLYSTDTYSDRQ